MTAPYQPQSRKETIREWLWRRLFVRSVKLRYDDWPKGEPENGKRGWRFSQ